MQFKFVLYIALILAAVALASAAPGVDSGDNIGLGSGILDKGLLNAVGGDRNINANGNCGNDNCGKCNCGKCNCGKGNCGKGNCGNGNCNDGNGC